jgi:hypothetical protein
MNNKHTPGPWIAHETAVVDSIERPLAETYKDMPRHLDEALANAHLIAAAPELLEALESLVQTLGYETANKLRVQGAMKQAKAAILKARGGT